MSGIEDDEQDLFRVYDDEEDEYPSASHGRRSQRLHEEEGKEETRPQERDRQQQQQLPPSDAMFDEFREDVETWMEVDNSIRNLQVMLRERRAFKSRLTEKITAFMRKYDLSNLDMGSAGIIRSRRSQVKTPVSQKTIRDDIESYFTNINNITMGMQLLDSVFNSRERVERVSLRRCLPPPSGTQRLR